MKRAAILLFTSLMLTYVVNAQTYNKFKLGFGTGLAVGKDRISPMRPNKGFLITLEPAYRINDNLAVGLRMEVVSYVHSADSIQGNSSITINGQYYFNTRQLRLFIGAGLGIYIKSQGAFGFYPRIGFDYKHFTMAFEYNFIPAGYTSATSGSYYFGVKIGGFFFGGKK